MVPIRYRFEHKYLISPQTAAILRSRAAGIMQPDTYADENGGYTINNVYLDDYRDNFYYAKYLGHYSRDKYRLRYYNNSLDFIRLERKHKDGILSYKETLRISTEQFTHMRDGHFGFTVYETAPLLQKLGVLHRLRMLRPTAVFAYRRETLTYKPGNVRLTFDGPLFDADKSTPPVQYDPLALSYGRVPYELLLEVKYIGFLPEIIKRLLGGLDLVQTEMSKYAIARERGYMVRK